MVSAGGVRDGVAAPTGGPEEETPLADVPRGLYIHSQGGIGRHRRDVSA
jgi:hypothetical protein